MKWAKLVCAQTMRWWRGQRSESADEGLARASVLGGCGRRHVEVCAFGFALHLDRAVRAL